MTTRSRNVLAALLLAALALIACGPDNAPPAPDSDSSQRYAGGVIPVDDQVYTITGQIVADVASLTRQTTPASMKVYDGYGSFFGPQFGGKGFVRLFVHVSIPATNLAPPEHIVLIKTSDTKASALLPGDIVTFRCRAQYEAVAAVRNEETFDSDKVETWELDYCRLKSPVISLGQARELELGDNE